MIEPLARQLINHYQGGFPLTLEPFVDVARKLEVTEAVVLQTLSSLLNTGVLTRFGPLYDAAKLGGAFTLVAMQVPEHQYEDVTATINSFREVAHNYRRDHALNMWFVIACDKAEVIQEVLHVIEESTGLPTYNFPKIQEFYIGLWLHIHKHGKVVTQPIPATAVSTSHGYQAAEIDDLDRDIIKATQAGLPITSQPYAAIAAQLSIRVESVIERLERMQQRQIIRRIGVVPNHYKLGLKGNGMSVWHVEDADINELGQKIGALDFVSHAYERPRNLPLWPYNLFAMVHGENRDEVREKVEIMAEILGGKCLQHEVLFSAGILKKTGMRLVA